jgi:hypothetical protein
MEVQSTKRKQFINGCFSLPPIIRLDFKIKICSYIAQLFPAAPHTDLKILKSFSFRGPRRRKKKKINLQMASIKPSAGVMHKIPDTFFFFS